MNRPGRKSRRDATGPAELEIEFESDIHQETADESSAARWLIPVTAVIAVVALATIIARPGVIPEPEPNNVGPEPPTAPEQPPQPNAEPVGEQVRPDGSESVEAEAGAVRLLIDPAKLAAPFTLVQLSELPNAEHSVRLVDLDGASQSLGNALFFQSTLWPSWPGANMRPFVIADSAMVYSSRGDVVVTDVTSGETMEVGIGAKVLDGLSDDEFWVIEPGERWVRRHRLADPNGGTSETAVDRFPFSDIGQPLTAAGDGLLVSPKVEAGLGKLAYWSPEGPLVAVELPTGFELFGANERVAILAGGDRLISHDLATGTPTEVALEGSADSLRGSLSPSGTRLALAQRHDLRSLGQILVVDTASGRQVALLDDVLDREFAWTSDQTLVTVGYTNGEFQAIEFDVAQDRRTPVATIDYPWIYVAVATNS